jgi:hypothetical protein
MTPSVASIQRPPRYKPGLVRQSFWQLAIDWRGLIVT